MEFELKLSSEINQRKRSNKSEKQLSEAENMKFYKTREVVIKFYGGY